MLMPGLALGTLVLGLESAPQASSTTATSDAGQSTLTVQSTLMAPTPVLLAARQLPRSTAARPSRTQPRTPVAKAKVIPARPRRVAARAVTARAKYEPATGAYLGAAIDTAQFTDNVDITGKLSRSMQAWNRESGRRHALQLGFVQFPYDDGNFPTWSTDPRGWLTAEVFANAASASGAAPIITLEPFGNPLQFSRDWKPGSTSYNATQAFAQAAGKWGKPLFIRWAHEMNGSWYPWAEWTDKNKNMQRDPGEETGFTPDDYKKSYRNVAQMFRRFAPNAALVWCPNSGLLGGGRRDVFRPFYPGDDVVDWVAMDVYERGWTLPMPGAKLWAGQFAHNLTHDAADDTNTPQNESVNFYETFASRKNKPFLLCETSATLSYRTDLNALERGAMNNAWKSAYWNGNEYGWMQSVYGTTHFSRQTGQSLLHAIDLTFPRLKGIVWFQVAKREYIPAEKTVDGRKEIVWFDDAYTDYRVGGGVLENGDRAFAEPEINLYRQLTNNPHFLSAIQG